MAENHNPSEEEPVCKTWARMVEVVLGLFLLVGTGIMAHYYAPPPTLSASPGNTAMTTIADARINGLNGSALNSSRASFSRMNCGSLPATWMN